MTGETRKTKQKRIIKNTMVLYARMLFLLGISLYTSRVVLHNLGISDYGLYNLTAGFIGFFAILSNTISGASSRFLNFAMGSDDKEALPKTFSCIVGIQWMMAGLVFVVAEIVGVWFINYHLNIPPGRMVAAHWCYQVAVFTFCNTIVTIPYQSVIVAHENMKIFAYVAIVSGVMKLLICILIAYSPIDKLIFFSVLMGILSICTRTFNRLYCKRRYPECSRGFKFDKQIFHELFVYAGWNYLGSIAAIIHQQGINILINLFFGTTINATQGIANQVKNAVNRFVSNFMAASRPQITQSYASGDISYMHSLITLACRMSHYLFLFFSLPIIFNTEAILFLWLKEVPEHSVLFIRLTLAYIMIWNISQPLSSGIGATGKVKYNQIVNSSLRITVIPICFVLLKLGGGVETLLIVPMVIDFIIIFTKLFFFRSYTNFDVSKYIREVLFQAVFLTLFTFVGCYLMNMALPEGNILCLFTRVALNTLFGGLVIFFIGCNKKERKFISKKFESLRRRKKFVVKNN